MELELTAVIDNGRLDFAKTFLCGAGAGQADAVWSQNDQFLAVGAAATLDLSNLQRTLLGSSQQIEFGGIRRSLLIYPAPRRHAADRRSRKRGMVLALRRRRESVSAPPLDSPLLLANRQQGWPVDSTASPLENRGRRRRRDLFPGHSRDLECRKIESSSGG